MINITTLRAAGLTDQQIVRVIEAEQAEQKAARREKNRIYQQNHRSRQQNSSDSADVADAETTKVVFPNKINDHVSTLAADIADSPPSPPSPVPPSFPPTPPIITPLPPSTLTPPQSAPAALGQLGFLPEEPRQARATRLREDWEPSSADIERARFRGLAPRQIADETTKFRNYWLAKPGKGATKISWARTWENWVIEAAGRNNGRPQFGGDYRAVNPSSIL